MCSCPRYINIFALHLSFPTLSSVRLQSLLLFLLVPIYSCLHLLSRNCVLSLVTETAHVLGIVDQHSCFVFPCSYDH